MVARVFIDGEVGTTGLQIRERLERRDDLSLISLSPEHRKDPAARREALNQADVSILCLPDEAAREAVALTQVETARIIDASTAHRTHPNWVYGFPEIESGRRSEIASARWVSNPGCYATAFIALVRPLVRSGLLPAAWPVSAHAVSGYSGGGKAMIAEFEDPDAPNHTTATVRAYALQLSHKHVPEMRAHAGLDHAPLFAPAVGRYFNGMIVEVPLALHALPRQPTVEDVRTVLAEAYGLGGFVRVAGREEDAAASTLDPEALNGSNSMTLHVFGSASLGQARLVAILDNLGKGAAGAAVQNLNLMLGLPEDAGLITYS